MLLFEPHPTGATAWSIVSSDGSAEKGTLVPGKPLLQQIATIAAREPLSSIAYVLANGGSLVHDAATRLTGAELPALRELATLAEPQNRLALDAAARLMETQPQAAHWLLCDTAFFSGMPDATRTYALPASYGARGFVRYGADGLCHQWVWNRLANGLSEAHDRHTKAGAATKLVCVRLCDAPTVAAIAGGEPLECSAGFSRLEGIPSATSSGDIDPSIPIELLAAGWTPDRIEEAFALRSGFGALAGRPCTFELLASPFDAATQHASTAVAYAIAKSIGASLATLGGGDVIAFASDACGRDEAFVRGICRGLEFAGVSLDPASRHGHGWVQITSPESAIQVVILAYDRERALQSLIARVTPA